MMFNQKHLPARDHRGHVRHPDLPVCDPDSDSRLLAELAELGYAHRFVELEDDRNGSYAHALYVAGDDNLSVWMPSSPSGRGWRLAGIWDHGARGPIALFVRPRLLTRLRALWIAWRGKRPLLAG